MQKGIILFRRPSAHNIITLSSDTLAYGTISIPVVPPTSKDIGYITGRLLPRHRNTIAAIINNVKDNHINGYGRNLLIIAYFSILIIRHTIFISEH